MNYRSLFEDRDVEAEIRARQEHPTVRLRPYQADAVDRVFEEWDAGRTATLLCLPTGGGKSICFSEVMRRWMEAHR